MYVFGISVKCFLIEVILGMNFFRELIFWKNCVKSYIEYD